MGEIWALVDINECETGAKMERGSGVKIPDGMYHLTVDIWVKNRDGKILLTQRHPRKIWGLKWECTEGAIVSGETIADGARRELFEETGIDIQSSALKHLGRTVIEDYHCIMHTFLVNLTDDVELKLQASEVVASKWVSPAELETMRGEMSEVIWAKFEEFKDRIV